MDRQSASSSTIAASSRSTRTAALLFRGVGDRRRGRGRCLRTKAEEEAVAVAETIAGQHGTWTWTRFRGDLHGAEIAGWVGRAGS